MPLRPEGMHLKYPLYPLKLAKLGTILGLLLELSTIGFRRVSCIQITAGEYLDIKKF